jgi:hypothetical protein
MAERDHTSMTQEKQIPIQYQTDEYRIQRALEAMEAAGDHEALGRTWRKGQDLRDHLEAKHRDGNAEAWQNLKRLHRALYSRQFLLGQSDAAST